jgi:uncharacterized protein YqeY
MLVQTITKDLTNAMKAGDKQTVSCLRMLLSAFKYKQVEAHKELDDSEALAVIRTQIKQVTDSLEQYTKGGREDLAKEESANLAILKAYLPQELSDDEIAAIARRIIAETNATKKEFGLVMKKTLAEAAGRADGKRVSGIVNGLLQ